MCVLIAKPEKRVRKKQRKKKYFIGINLTLDALRRIKKIILTSESNLPENLRAFTNNPNLFETIGMPPFLALDESRENEV